MRNLPDVLVSQLQSLGHAFDTVLTGQPAGTVWHAAQEDGRFLITQDLDFSDMRRQDARAHDFRSVKLV